MNKKGGLIRKVSKCGWGLAGKMMHPEGVLRLVEFAHYVDQFGKFILREVSDGNDQRIGLGLSSSCAYALLVILILNLDDLGLEFLCYLIKPLLIGDDSQ